MVGCAYSHCVDVVSIKYFLIILGGKYRNLPDVRAPFIDRIDMLFCRIQPAFVDIAERKDQRLRAPCEVVAMSSGDKTVADYSHVYFAAWSDSSAPQNPRRNHLDSKEGNRRLSKKSLLPILS